MGLSRYTDIVFSNNRRGCDIFCARQTYGEFIRTVNSRRGLRLLFAEQKEVDRINYPFCLGNNRVLAAPTIRLIPANTIVFMISLPRNVL